MNKLEIGASVYGINNSIDTVFFFSHRDEAAFSVMRTISTLYYTISLSYDHYIYANGILIPARNVQIGDLLETEIGPDAVVSLSDTIKRGLYNPHTLSGDIFVNGIWTSTYTGAVRPYLAHMLLAPVRFLFSTETNKTVANYVSIIK